MTTGNLLRIHQRQNRSDPACCVGSGFHRLDDVGAADDRCQRDVLSRIDLDAGGVDLYPGSASRSGRALILGEPAPGEQGSVPNQRFGLGMDPPVF